FSSRRRRTRFSRDWSSDVCSSDLARVTLAAAAGYLLMFRFDALSVDGRFLGPLGLSLAAGLAAWVEWVLLRRHLRRLIGHVTIQIGRASCRERGCSSTVTVADQDA